MSNKPIPKGTTTAHFVKFINELLDIMDMDESMKGHYLVLAMHQFISLSPWFAKSKAEAIGLYTCHLIHLN